MPPREEGSRALHDYFPCSFSSRRQSCPPDTRGPGLSRTRMCPYPGLDQWNWSSCKAI
jgi:hypothetical protein